LGDFWDNPYNTGTIDLRLMMKCIDFFSRQTIKTTMIPGNHDYFGGNADEHALQCFAHLVDVISSPTLYGCMLYLPYRKGGYSRVEMTRFKHRGATVVFSHNDLKTMETRLHVLSQEGMELNSFDGMVVFNGHYHYPSSHGNVHNIGTAYAVHSSENLHQKHIWDIVISNTDGMLVSMNKTPIRLDNRVFQDGFNSMLQPGDTVITNREKDDQMLNDIVIVNRKTPPDVKITLRLDSWQHMVREATEIFYKDDAVIEDSSCFNISEDIIASIKSTGLEPSVTKSHSPIRLEIDSIAMIDYCGVKYYDLSFVNGITLVHGANGVGKTIKFVSALIYCLCGVVDKRNYGKHLLNQLGTNTQVSIVGNINGVRFTLIRSYINKKTKIEFAINDEIILRPTINAIQQEINFRLFDIESSMGSSSHRLYAFLKTNLFFTQNGVNLDDFKFMLFDKTLRQLRFDRKNYIELLETNKNKTVVVDEKIAAFEETYEFEEIGLTSYEEHRFTQLTALKVVKESLTPVPQPDVIPSEASAHRAAFHTMLITCRYNNFQPFEHYCGLHVFPMPEEFHLITKTYATALHENKIIRQQNSYLLAKKECPICETLLNDSRILDTVERRRKLIVDTTSMMKTMDDYSKFLEEQQLWKRANLYVQALEDHLGINVNTYVRYLRTLATINANILKHENSQEGVEWTPELYYKNILDAKIEKEQLVSEREHLYSLLLKNTRAIEIMEYIVDAFNEIVLPDKNVTNLSGGEYENLVLRTFFANRKYVQGWKFWSSNILIMDEPGPHMDSKAFKSMLESIDIEKVYIITHNAIENYSTLEL